MLPGSVEGELDVRAFWEALARLAGEQAGLDVRVTVQKEDAAGTDGR